MYSVGQVLYVILNQKQKVIPVQVIEQVVRRSLKGEETQYTVNVPSRNGFKAYNLHDLDGEIHETVESAMGELTDKANQSITRIIENAQKIATHSFDADPDVDDVLFDPKETDTENKVKITLENGTIANVKIPTNLT